MPDFWRLKFTNSLFIVLMAGIKPGRTNGRGEIVNFTMKPQESKPKAQLDWLGSCVQLPNDNEDAAFTPPKNVTLPADSYLSS